MAVYIHHTINALCKAENFIVQNYAATNAVYESTQSAALYGASQNAKFFDTLYKVNYLFYFIDFSSLCIGTYHLLEQFDQKYHLFYYLSSFHPEDQNFIVFGGVAAFALTASMVVWTVNRIMKKWADPSLQTISEFDDGYRKETLKVELDRPFNEKVRQLFFVSKTIINLSLLFFGPANPLLAIGIATELTSLGIITARKWLKISKQVDYDTIPLHNTLSKVKASFYLLMRPISNSQNHSEDTQCSICHDNPATIDAYFCSNHVYHARCVLTYVKQKMNTLIDEMHDIQRKVSTKVVPLLGLVSIQKEASYTVSIPKTALPSCPNCREQPLFNSFKLKLTDVAYGNSEVRVKWG